MKLDLSFSLGSAAHQAGGGLPSPPSGYSYGYIKDGQQLNQLVYVTLSNGTSHPTIARTQ